MNSFVKPSVSNQIVNERGEVFPSARSLAKNLGISKNSVLKPLRVGKPFTYNGHTYSLFEHPIVNDESIEVEGANVISEIPQEYAQEYKEFLESKRASEVPFEVFDFKKSKYKEGSRYAVALFSDAHIEETVNASSVLGLNEYNIDIAKQRIEKYFVNLANCLNRDNVEELIFASLGDTISGYIHDELSQTNGVSPLEAIEIGQNLIYNGLRYLCNEANLSNIKFIGIVGNHGRTTKKIQHSNGYKMNYEWLMYKNIQKQCELTELPIEFYIPESEIAVVDTVDEKRFIFCHGFQVKSSGSGAICGIFPALNRLSMKWGKTFKQNKIYLGHFHSCTSIPNAVVNGSIIGYNAFAMTNGFECEDPCQFYEVYDTEIGELLSRKIYCD